MSALLDSLLRSGTTVERNGVLVGSTPKINYLTEAAVETNASNGSIDVSIPTGSDGGSLPVGTNKQIIAYSGAVAEAVNSPTGEWTLYTDESDPTLLSYFNTTDDNGNIGAGSVGGYWRRTGAPLSNGTIDFTITFILGSGYTGTGDFTFRVLPAGLALNAKFMIHSHVVLQDQNTPANNASGYCVDLADMTVRVIVDIAPGGTGVDSNIEPTSPFTFAAGDTIRIQGSMQLFNDC